MADNWAPLVSPFVDGAYATVKGRVRTEVVHRQLLEHLPPPPAAVLDVGGGAGHQSRPLARLGYEVTLLDPSAAMLEKARSLLARETTAVRRRFSLLEGRGENAGALTEGRRFDAVLCHGVLMYLEDPSELIATLCTCTAEGAIVSLLALNARAMAVRPAMEGRWSDALISFDRRSETGVLGVETRGDTAEQLGGLLEQHGVSPEAWYGVWLFSDWLELAGKPAEEAKLAEIAEVELAAGARDPYRQMSRLFHLLGRRGGLSEASGSSPR